MIETEVSVATLATCQVVGITGGGTLTALCSGSRQVNRRRYLLCASLRCVRLEIEKDR